MALSVLISSIFLIDLYRGFTDITAVILVLLIFFLGYLGAMAEHLVDSNELLLKSQYALINEQQEVLEAVMRQVALLKKRPNG